MKVKAFDEANVIPGTFFLYSYFEPTVIVTAFRQVKFFLIAFTSLQCQAGEFPEFVCPIRIL